MRLAVYAVAALGLLALGAAAGYRTADDKWASEWAIRDAADLRAQVAAEAAERAKEQQWQHSAERIQADALQSLEQARSAADAAQSDADRLREQIAKLQTRVSGLGASAGPAVSSASATRAAMVLSELLDSCIGQRQEIAAAFDSARVRGLACEASYQSLAGRAQ